MLALCSDSPLHTWRDASTVAPTTWAAAWCMSAKTGSSSVPRPCSASSPALGPAAGDRLDQAAVVDGGEQVVVGDRRLDHAAACSSTPSSSARRMVRSTRTGDIGWPGPKSYSTGSGRRRRTRDRGTPCDGRYPQRARRAAGTRGVESHLSDRVRDSSHGHHDHPRHRPRPRLPPVAGRVRHLRAGAARRRPPLRRGVPGREPPDRGHRPQAHRAGHRSPHLGPGRARGRRVGPVVRRLRRPRPGPVGRGRPARRPAVHRGLRRCSSASSGA